MSKKIAILILLILIFSLIFYKTNEEFLTKEKIEHSGIIFSNDIETSNDYLNILLLKGSDQFTVHYKNDFKKEDCFIEKDLSSLKVKNTIPVIINENKNDLEKFLNSLSCENHILYTQFNFTEYEFFNENIIDNVDNIDKLKVDCPLCLYGVYYFSKKCGKDKYEFLNNNLYFKSEGNSINKSDKISFVGDMMFDRGVNLLIKQNNNFNYPFEKIKKYLNYSGTLVGNLEGPIVNNMTFISTHSMSFNFDKRNTKAFKDNNFQILSLANNHTSNRGSAGLEETKTFLKDNDIDYVGEPHGCSLNDIVIKDDIIFYAVNTTFPFNCSNEEIISNIKKLDKEKFLVVLMHWGDEYVHNASQSQINLAHSIIDAGADLIIGGHPHVIQNIEKYNNKLIFYSLGNFIFDQYFSKETQQGIMVGLELKKNEQIYNLFVIEEEKAQPVIVKESESILNWLASISSSSLENEIKKGQIIIYPKD